MTSQPYEPRTGILHRNLLFTRCYLWFILASVLDVIVTTLVISIGGYEANPLAGLVIGRFGMHGALMFKFTLMLVVILCCEIIGRRDERIGRSIASFAAAVPALAAILGCMLILQAAGMQ